MTEPRIGTCSWKYPEWQGLVYSAARGIDYLAEYSGRYDTVEIDQWFWSLFAGSEGARMPNQRDVAEYCTSVPAPFRFTVKVPNAITLTHYYAKKKSDPLQPNPFLFSPDVFQAFLSILAPLNDRIGALIFQFEYLNREKMPSQKQFHDRFDHFLARIPRPCPYAVEVRNKNYLNVSFFNFLQRNQLAPVLIEGYWMPPVAEVYRKWRDTIHTSPLVVIRLMGRDRSGIEKAAGKKWDRIVDPQDDALDRIAEMVADLKAAGLPVYVNVNNHYEGCAPLTISRLKSRLQAGCVSEGE